jgi:hypothetical protein
MTVTGNAKVLFAAEPGQTCSRIGCGEPATTTLSLPIADSEETLILATCRPCGIAAALDWTEQ